MMTTVCAAVGPAAPPMPPTAMARAAVTTATPATGRPRRPAGAATVLVSRSSYKLVDVPTTEPAASDVMRNRGVPDSAGVDAYIALSVVSGYGTTTDLPEAWTGAGRDGRTRGR